MKVCGSNNFKQLLVNSNNKSTRFLFPPKVVGPPENCPLDVSTLLSFSTYREHTVYIDRNNQAFAIGDNSSNQISYTLPRSLDKVTQIQYTDKENNSFKFISAVCGYAYTLYILQSEAKNSYPQLAYSSKSHNLTLYNFCHFPLGIFGGDQLSASILSDGSIAIFSTETQNPPILSLPGWEKAISIACCLNFLIALSINNKVYILQSKRSNFYSTFEPISELKDIKITHISGNRKHCLCVSEDGRVFGFGSNEYGRLGLKEDAIKFTQIISLKEHVITNAFAGSSHSLFLTSQGKILACGLNDCGQALHVIGPSKDCFNVPVETIIPKDGTFCIAGYSLSVVFVGVKMPENMPNKTIDKNLFKKKFDLDLDLDSKQNRQEKAVQTKTENNKQSFENNFEFVDDSEIENMTEIEQLGTEISSKIIKVSLPQYYIIKVFDQNLHPKISENENENENNKNEIDITQMKEFMKEYEIIKFLNHPNIIKAFGFYKGDENHKPYFRLEYFPTNLMQSVTTLNCVERISIIYEICSAMKYIHEFGLINNIYLIHCNLNPECILLDESNHVKISDFAHSIIIENDEEENEIEKEKLMIEKSEFVAPEVFNGSDNFDQKIDVYSFGMIVYFILNFGHLPKIDHENREAIRIPDSINQNSRELIEKCLDFSPIKRPSFTEILKFIKEKKYQLIDGVKYAQIKKRLSL